MNRTQRGFKLFAALWLCSLALSPAAEPAAPPAKRLQPARWLLILDTSAAMEKRAKAVEGITAELLATSMNGQMKAGDELGIWSYNKELYAGVAPMQTWDPARSNLITSRTIDFLSRQVYRDKPKIEVVLPEVVRVIRESRQLTIIWFSDGTQKFSGTPLDEDLNSATARLKPSLDKSRMPIVTVLRGHHGQLTGQNVSLAPWPVEFPPLPVEPEATNAVAKATNAVAKPAPTAKPIIITGSKKPAPESPAPVEMKGGSVKLRPAPEEAAVAPTPAKVAPAVEVQPLPLATTEPAPVVAPIKPEPVLVEPAVPAEARPTEHVAATPPPPATATPTPSTPTAPVAAPAATPTPATATSAGAITAHKWPLILGIGFMWAAVIAALVLVRRARRANATSLITRSYERGPK